MFLYRPLEINYISKIPIHMDPISDEINHDYKKDITNHEANKTSISNTNINNSYTSNIYGSLDKNGIPRICSTDADQIIYYLLPDY